MELKTNANSIKLMIHEAFTKAYIAFRYYSIKYPERSYDKEQSRKQFLQDKNIDKVIIRKVVDLIYKEQKELIKK